MNLKSMAILQLALLAGSLNNSQAGEDTSKDSIYNSKFFDSDKSINEANQKRFRKALKKGFIGSYEDFIKLNAAGIAGNVKRI